MLLDDLNSLVRQIIMQLVQSGYKLTSVGKTLLGSNSYSPITKLINDDSTNFGYRPLQKIGKLVHKDLYLVYLGEEDFAIKNQLEEINIKTLNNLKEKIALYINNKEEASSLSTPSPNGSLDNLTRILNILNNDGTKLE